MIAAHTALARILPAALVLAFVLAFAMPVQAQSRDALHNAAVQATRKAEQADFNNPTSLRRVMVDLAAALKALRFSEAEAREGGKAEPPAIAGLRPGEFAAPDVSVLRPGDRSVPLAQVPDIWFAWHQDQAETALVDLLKALDAKQADNQARQRVAAIGFHLDAMLKPPAGLQ